MISYISDKNDYTKKRKILITKLLGGDFDGVFNYIYNLLTHINLQNVQFDLYISAGDIVPIFIYPRLMEMGVNVFVGTRLRNQHSYRIDIESLNTLMKEHKYDAMYVNSGHPLFTAIQIWVARKNKLKRLITHSHNSVTTKIEKERNLKKMLFFFSRKYISHNATFFLACSEIAGDWLYGKNIMKTRGRIVKNGIAIENYLFNLSERERLRKVHDIKETCIVIGLTANFTPQKNHLFLVKVFSEFLKFSSDSVLLLVGDGDGKNNILEEAKKLGLAEKIIFTGSVSNANEYYSVMDVFVMPSIHEGLPFVGIEAQASCLPCLFSDVITQEINLTDYAHFYSLENSPNEWAEKISKLLFQISLERRIKDSILNMELIKKSGFDLKQMTDNISEILDIKDLEE